MFVKSEYAKIEDDNRRLYIIRHDASEEAPYRPASSTLTGAGGQGIAMQTSQCMQRFRRTTFETDAVALGLTNDLPI